MEVLKIVELYKARVVDLAADVAIVEAAGTEAEIDALVALLRGFGIKELSAPGPSSWSAGPGRSRSQARCRLECITTTTRPVDTLRASTVAVIGYGSQGHAHALNLHESASTSSSGCSRQQESRGRGGGGLDVFDIGDAVRRADVIMLAVPDTAAKAVYDAEVAPNLRPGQLLLFAHGFNIHFDRIAPPYDIDVGMVAPKGRGSRPQRLPVGRRRAGAVRRPPGRDGHGPPATLAYARGLGKTRAGVLETTFDEETETDLFGEQAVLCGGTRALVKMSFETLVEAGYEPGLAYFETLHELKLIVDLLYRGGLNFMRFSVSDTAEYGDYVSGARIINAETRGIMRAVLRDIQDGTFARNWIAENDNGRPNFERMRAADRDHPIEVIGAELRAQMAFLNPVVVRAGQAQAAAGHAAHPSPAATASAGAGAGGTSR